jgi:hypothetical protein
MSIETPTLGRVLRIFALAQVAAILIPLILAMFDVDLGSSVNLTGSFIAAIAAAHVFVQKFGRAPTQDERRRLAWLSLTIAWAISLGMMGILIGVGGQAAIDMFGSLLQALPSAVLIVIIIVISGLYLGAYHVAYGPLARNFEKKLATKRP